MAQAGGNDGAQQLLGRGGGTPHDRWWSGEEGSKENGQEREKERRGGQEQEEGRSGDAQLIDFDFESS